MRHTFVTMILSIGLFAASFGAVKAEPVVVELFTSQGCYSCPPAELYLGELSKNPEIVALEFHVDYWDDLVHGADGKWKDVFSQPEFTGRQWIYAGNLPKGQVYTPQMVVDGTAFAVGSNRRDVRRLIAKSKELKEMAIARKQSYAKVSIAQQTPTEFAANIADQSERAVSVWLVRFMKNVTTRVRSGENKGKKLTSHNIVTGVKHLAAWSGTSQQVAFSVKDLKPAESCAILVQEDAQGPIFGAALCPSKTPNG